jgi:hypothetical protein
MDTIIALALIALFTSPLWYPIFFVSRLESQGRNARLEHQLWDWDDE